MRLLHPRTLKIVSQMGYDEFANATVSKKQIISHAWSEVFKFVKSGKSHPKMFIKPHHILGIYLGQVYEIGKSIGCNLNMDLVYTLDEIIQYGFEHYDVWYMKERLMDYFDDMYLFSDMVSLYYKGVNLFSYEFGDEWRKYVPVESHKEIQRQVSKTLDKRSN